MCVFVCVCVCVCVYLNVYVQNSLALRQGELLSIGVYCVGNLHSVDLPRDDSNQMLIRITETLASINTLR